jgi:hypothetical protein
VTDKGTRNRRAAPGANPAVEAIQPSSFLTTAAASTIAFRFPNAVARGMY